MNRNMSNQKLMKMKYPFDSNAMDEDSMEEDSMDEDSMEDNLSDRIDVVNESDEM